MKLSLKKITTDRSLQRRWALSDAEPVISYLPPDTEFSPADLRIWWNEGAGDPAKDHTLHIYAGRLSGTTTSRPTGSTATTNTPYRSGSKNSLTSSTKI